MRRLILHSRLCPGDVMTMTAAVEALHHCFPGEFETDVRTPAPEIWQHNPRLTPIADGDGEEIRLEYPTIHQSNQRLVSFLDGYAIHLGCRLGIGLRAVTNRPLLYLSPEEKRWVNQVEQHHGHRGPFWLVNAGTKTDFTAKQWPLEHYQQVIDATRGRIQWVQIGALEHLHPPLSGVIDLRGRTDHRQLIRLAYHAAGGLGPVTYLQHLCAAWEKPYVCLVGGREPAAWVQYPRQVTLHTIGQLDCCRGGACWKSRVVPLGDGDSKDSSLCQQPVTTLARPVGRCMQLITPAEVLAVLERMLNA